METDEQRIISRILEGQKEEYRHLVRAYEAMVYSLVMELAGDSETARDVTQEAFVRAYNHLAEYDAAKGKFSTWLMTIAYHLAIGNSRKKRRKPPTLSLRSMENVADDSAVDEFFDSDDRAMAEQLADAVGRLDEEERAVLSLFYRDNASIAEIAEVEGTRAGTIATRLSRIRRKLYRYMRGDSKNH